MTHMPLAPSLTLCAMRKHVAVLWVSNKQRWHIVCYAPIWQHAFLNCRPTKEKDFLQLLTV